MKSSLKLNKAKFPSGSGSTVEPMLEAFRTFEKKSDHLEKAYLRLQNNIKKINIELDKKNSELSRNLQELKKVKNFLNHILESIPQGVIVINRQGEITIFNKGASQMTGYTPAEVVGQPYRSFFGQGVRGEPLLIRLFEQQPPYLKKEKRLRIKDGQEIPVESSSALVKDSHQGIVGAVEFLQDKSEIKKIEEEMRKSQTLLELGRLSATVAHEIRNPLGGIGGFAALLERDLEVHDPRRKLVKKIIQGVASLNKIVSNLLVYTRPLQCEFVNTDMVKLVEEMIAFAQIEIEKNGRSIAVQQQLPTHSLYGRVDPEKMQQLILNLMINAIQAILHEGVIILRLRTATADENTALPSLVLEIEDNGVGIEPKHLSEIFNPFFTTKESGTGLGLAICKKIIEEHQGRILVKSQPRVGTTFSVYVPAVQSSEEKE